MIVCQFELYLASRRGEVKGRFFFLGKGSPMPETKPYFDVERITGCLQYDIENVITAYQNDARGAKKKYIDAFTEVYMDIRKIIDECSPKEYNLSFKCSLNWLFEDIIGNENLLDNHTW